MNAHVATAGGADGGRGAQSVLFHRPLISGEPLTEQLVVRLVDEVLAEPVNLFEAPLLGI